MELKEVLGRRRTIRYFKPYRAPERGTIQKMLEAARRASCVGNINSTRAVVIWRDRATDELLDALRGRLSGAMDTAPCFILWYWDKQAYYEQGDRLHGLTETRRTGFDREAAHRSIDEQTMPFFRKAWPDLFQGPLPPMDAGQTIAQATLVAYEEGLGTCLMGTGSTAKVASLLGLPETAMPVCLQALGYPAEEWEAGGQTVKLPFERLFFEMKCGTPFPEDPAVVEELKAAKLIQAPAPLPWRDAEFRWLAEVFDLPAKAAAGAARFVERGEQ